MSRAYGKLALHGDRWVIPEAEPHVVIKLKQIFPKIPKADPPPYSFPATPETAADLDWFMNRYPLAASPHDLAMLRLERREYEKAANEVARILSGDYLPPALPGVAEGFALRPYQHQAIEMLRAVGGLLLGDEVGLGKTYIAAGACLIPGALPATVVCHAHLQKQWCEVIEKFTNLRAHAIKVTKPYALPPCDVRVMRYSQLAGWADVLELMGCGLVVWDEVQELRTGEGDAPDKPIAKGVAARRLAVAARMRLGLSATPVYNYGSEIFNVLRYINPKVLDDWSSFIREWCSGGQVKEPKALGTYLREQRVFLRRTKADVGQQMPPINKIVDFVDYDTLAFSAFEDEGRRLAVQATTAKDFKDRGEAARMLDLKLRHTTGVAKAKAVAKVVKAIVQNGEKVVLVGWHRDVYETWLYELRDLNPQLYTGSESAAGKDRARQAFCSDESDILIMSLRSGAGLDGLQFHCSTMVFGELDWSPGIHHQCLGRLDREGQTEPVTGIFLVADNGSDPPMLEVLGLKASQAAGIVDPSLGVQAAHSDKTKLQMLVGRYLPKGGASA
jgi:superfamily II DNA or RNA helicase